MFVISYNVFPFRPSQPSVLFASKARAFLSEAPIRCSTLGYPLGVKHI